MPERDIFYLNIAAFQIEVERVVETRLRERPVAIAIPHSARSTLLEVSQEAQAEGVSAGMSLGVALRVCRGLVVIPPNPGLYDQASRALGDVVAQFTPVWEPRRAGHVYLDMSGSRRLFGPPRDAAWRLEKEIEREIRLRGALGVAANKLVSRIAARTVPPRSIIDIERGNESSFLAPLSVGLLPGIGAVRLHALFEELNLRFIGQIAATPPPSLRMVFGAFAIVLHQRALGLDAEPVRPPARRPASEEEITLAEDTNDDILLLGHLYTLVERVAARMRKSNMPATAATLLMRYSDGVEVSRRAAIRAPSFWDFELYPEVERLYYKANERRTRVRHMRVSFDHLAPAAGRQPSQLQLALDDPDAVVERGTRLVQALDRIRAKHGFDAIRYLKSCQLSVVSCQFPERRRDEEGIQRTHRLAEVRRLGDRNIQNNPWIPEGRDVRVGQPIEAGGGVGAEQYCRGPRQVDQRRISALSRPGERFSSRSGNTDIHRSESPIPDEAEGRGPFGEDSGSWTPVEWPLEFLPPGIARIAESCQNGQPTTVN